MSCMYKVQQKKNKEKKNSFSIFRNEETKKKQV